MCHWQPVEVESVEKHLSENQPFKSMFCLFFCLDTKETKNQGKPDRSARFSGLARRQKPLGK